MSLVPWRGRSAEGRGQQRPDCCAPKAGSKPVTVAKGTAPPVPAGTYPSPMVAVAGQDGSATPRQELTQESAPEDLAMVTLLKAADSDTFRSIKQAILMCMLIRSVRRPARGRRRSSLIAVSLLASIGAAHWHIWSLLLQLTHLSQANMHRLVWGGPTRRTSSAASLQTNGANRPPPQ